MVGSQGVARMILHLQRTTSHLCDYDIRDCQVTADKCVYRSLIPFAATAGET